MSEVIRVCIGTEPRARVPESVLIHSILKNTKSRIMFYPMDGPEWDHPNLPSGHTGFSFRRWLIPYHFNYEGKAIYLDSDQIVFGDIQELWGKDKEYSPEHEDTAVWCCKKRQPLWSVMLIDCAKAKEFWGWWPKKLFESMENEQLSKQDVMHRSWIEPPPQIIEPGWNHIDQYYQDETKLLHYSNLRTQPWFNLNHELRSFWESYLIDAIKEEVLSREDFMSGRECFNKKIGLNPYYEKYLELFD